MKRSLLLMLLLLFPLLGFAATKTAQGPDFNAVYQQLVKTGDNIVANYDSHNGMASLDAFSSLYFDQYEGKGMENAVMAISPTINSKTEALFTQLIGYASQNAPKAKIESTWSVLKVRLQDDLSLLQSNQPTTFIEVLIQSFIILLREGFEAMLVITALLTYLRRSGHQDKSRVIYHGIGYALVASALMAILFATVFKTAGANREALEGGTMLVAAGILFYVSYWLLSKRESVVWQGYIKSKINKALTKGSLFALGLAAFLAVFREGAETILFYQALAIGSHGQYLALFLGVVLALAALIAVYFVMKNAAIRIPYKVFFTITAIFLYYMAFYFIGGGILELQEAGLVSITPVSWLPQITWLGIYGTAESTGAQAIFLFLSILGILIWWLRKPARAQALGVKV